MHNLASMCENQGCKKEAEELEVQLVGARQSVLGSEHFNTLAGRNNLASTYKKQR